jgi:streptomycin 6-kinase
MITIPEAFATATITREGEAGRRWLAELPRWVERLCRQWQLVVDGPLRHGYLGLVLPVRRGELRCALKLAWLDEATATEATALRAWAGHGAVRLLESEPALGAMLLERLDPQRTLAGVGIEAAIPIAGQLLRRLAIPAPAGLPAQPALAEAIAGHLPVRWERYGRPMPRRLVDHACALAGQLGQAGQALLVNYDLHYENILAGQREAWLAIDPKPVAGDPEFGVAQLLWCRLEEIERRGGLDRHFQALVEAAELDAGLSRAWTLVRCLDYWLWGLSVGLTDDPARCQVITTWLQGSRVAR